MHKHTYVPYYRENGKYAFHRCKLCQMELFRPDMIHRMFSQE